ncbi:CHAT domain-containing protein [Flammeovirga agarivorans]|uniref:CHAT domain-containing protein n=1 Tax=Flammeovirga agarivorans TaxID=2726742 RepID=A0A7X8XUR4_9BACT|nr:CHAT domain-containing protein [Flammeovirga agarivorans]NLR90365.1 CHAT domain-containing protein [Flammeovirga agarivorans]
MMLSYKNVKRAFLFLTLFLNFTYLSIAEEAERIITPDSIYSLQFQGKLLDAKKLSKAWVSQVKSKFGSKSVEVVIPLIVSSELAILRKEYQTAQTFLDESIQIMDNSSGWLYPDYGLALNYKAYCLLSLGDTYKAIPIVNESEMIYTKTLTKQHPDYNLCIINRAIIHLNLNEFEKSEEYFNQSLSSYNTNFGKSKVESTVKIEWIKNLQAQLYTKWFKPEKANKILEEVQSSLIAQHLEKSPLFTDMLLEIGDVFLLKNEYRMAYTHYDDCKELLEASLGPKHPATLVAYFKIANTLKAQNYFKNAISFYEKIISNFDVNNSDNNVYVESLLQLADIYMMKGDTKNATNYLAKSQEHNYNKRDLDFFYLKVAGELDFINGDYISAELKLMELISLVRQEKVFFTRHYSDAVAVLGSLFVTLGRVNDAVNICSSELRFIKKRNMQGGLSYFKVKLSLLNAQLSEGDEDINLIVQETQQSIDSVILNLNPNHTLLIKGNNILGKAALKNREFDLALEYFEKADQFAEKQGIDEKEYQRIEIIDCKGNIYLAQKKYELALAEYKKVVNTFDNTSIYKPGIMARIAYVNSLQNKWPEAEQLILEAVDLRFKQYDEQLKFTSEDEKINFIHYSSGVFVYFYSMMASERGIKSPLMRAKAYDIHTNYRKYFLKEAMTRKNKIEQLNEYRNSVMFTNYAENLKHLKSKLATVNFMSKSERKALGIDTYMTTDRINNLEKSLVYATNTKQDSLGIKKSIKWQDTQKSLEEGEVAIEIIKLKNINKAKESYAAIIISKELKSPKFVPIGNARLMETDLLAIYNRLTTPHSRSLVMSTNKPKKKVNPYDYYWKPIRKVLDTLNITTTKIYLSKDGIYNGINLNIMKNSATGKHIIEEENIHLVISTADIKTKTQKKLVSKDILLVGNPVFQHDGTSGEGVSRGVTEEATSDSDGGYYFYLNNLPGTDTEIKNAETMFKKQGWNVTSLSQFQATEENIKGMKTSPYIMHVATHGFYLDELQFPILNNPLLKSGLFFTEVSQKENRELTDIYDSGNDGILTAYEVKGLNLKNTELLILSACQTGVSEISAGDGISGLQYAFSIAGVNSIIMSLWSVDDAATQKLMNEFYKQWFETKNKDIAFKNAQLALKKEYPNPYYWGAFVLIN